MQAYKKTALSSLVTSACRRSRWTFPRSRPAASRALRVPHPRPRVLRRVRSEVRRRRSPTWPTRLGKKPKRVACLQYRSSPHNVGLNFARFWDLFASLSLSYLCILKKAPRGDATLKIYPSKFGVNQAQCTPNMQDDVCLLVHSIILVY